MLYRPRNPKALSRLSEGPCWLFLCLAIRAARFERKSASPALGGDRRWRQYKICSLCSLAIISDCIADVFPPFTADWGVASADLPKQPSRSINIWPHLKVKSLEIWFNVNWLLWSQHGLHLTPYFAAGPDFASQRSETAKGSIFSVTESQWRYRLE